MRWASLCTLPLWIAACGGEAGTAAPDAGPDGGSAPPCMEQCELNQVCVDGECVDAVSDMDSDGIAAPSDCDDQDPDITLSASRACMVGCARGVAVCSMGAWSDCDADPASCDPDAGAATDAGTAAADAATGDPPEIHTIDYPVLAHGGDLRVEGLRLSRVSSVQVGGVAQAFVIEDDSALEVTSLDDAVPVGARMLVATTDAGLRASFPLTVVHLVINELDQEAESGRNQFVELATGVPGASLAGYVLALIDGDRESTYGQVQLPATTDAEGLLLVGHAGLTPSPAVEWAEHLRDADNAPNAVAVYQRPALPTEEVSVEGLIDAALYHSGGTDRPENVSLAFLFEEPEDTASIEDPDDSRLRSIGRCEPARRTSSAFRLLPLTPGEPNGC